MTHDELLKAYPKVSVAVAYTELIICGTGIDTEEEEAGWDVMMAAQPSMSIEEVLECIREAMKGETDCDAPTALLQTYHSQYMTYLRGKMGMM